jgi:hypothetical protein
MRERQIKPSQYTRARVVQIQFDYLSHRSQVISRDDERIELEYMIVDRAWCPVAIGHRNYLFAGSDNGEAGGQPYSMV